MTRRIHLEGFSLAVRDDERNHDVSVATRIIVDDCYGLRALRRIKRRVPVILDIGGHIGSFGVLAKSLWPESFLIALEPNREAAELYRENLDANGIEDALVLHGAITYQSELLAKMDNLMKPGEQHRISDAPTLTFEELCEKFAIEEISLLKLDCKKGERSFCSNVSLAAASRSKLVLGKYHAQGGFERFALNARQAFPHLYFYGDSPDPIGPFWAFPNLRTAFAFSLARKIESISKFFKTQSTSTEPDNALLEPPPEREVAQY